MTPAPEGAVAPLFATDLEQRQRSPRHVVLTVFVASVTALLCAIAGRVSIWTLGVLLGLVCLSTLLAALAYRARRRAYRFLSVADGYLQFSAIAYLIFDSKSAASPLWALSCLLALRWTPMVRGTFSIGSLQLLLSHAPLALAFLILGQYADSLFAISAFFATLSVQSSTSKSAAEAMRMEKEQQRLEREYAEEQLSQERTRVARELHDGAAADVTALILQLRRRAFRQHDAAAADALEAKTKKVLSDMRAVVESLREDPQANSSSAN